MTEALVMTLSPRGGHADLPSSAATGQAELNQLRLSVVSPARQSTTMAETFPPRWMEDAVYEVQGSGALPAVKGEFLRRLASVIIQLPRNTPRPQIGVGDDGSVALEWNIGPAHLGIQIDHDESYDTVFLDFEDEESVSEAPLSAALSVVVNFFEHLNF